MCFLALKHVKRTMKVAKNKRIMAARQVHMPTPQVAALPVPSALTLLRMMPNEAKSVAMTTRVMTHARALTRDARRAPQTPLPRARRKAMKERTQAIGWRIMTLVRPSAVAEPAVENPVPSTAPMMYAGLYPMVFGLHISPMVL